MTSNATTAFDQLRATWETLGDDDPCWAILSWRGKRGKWDKDEFFETGRVEIAELVTRLKGFGFMPSEGPVLDFGCGIGRLVLAFAQHFDTVHGVDIAGSMVERARRLNPFGKRVAYHINQKIDLSLFPDATFRLVHSHLVLQHIPPDCSKAYIAEFCRVLKPGGVVAFQIPSHHAVTLKTVTERVLPRSATALLKRTKNRQEASMDMYGIPQNEVQAILNRGSLKILEIDAPAEPINSWYNRWYFAQKA